MASSCQAASYSHGSLAEFVVLFDTGSSDFWVNTTGRSLELTNTTSLVTGIGYGKGQVEGTIDFAKLEIGDFVIPSQGAYSSDSSVCISRYTQHRLR